MLGRAGQQVCPFFVECSDHFEILPLHIGVDPDIVDFGIALRLDFTGLRDALRNLLRAASGGG